MKGIQTGCPLFHTQSTHLALRAPRAVYFEEAEDETADIADDEAAD